MKRRQSRHQGFTLVELMVALALGLILTGAVMSAFISNRQVYAASQTIGRIQENARSAFELLSRDIREAAGNPCNSALQPINVTRDQSLPGNDYAVWQDGLLGADATAGGRQADRIVLKSASETSATIDSDNSTNVNIRVLPDASAFNEGDIVLVCDPEHAAIFQITKAGNDIKVQTNNSANPGNSTNCLSPSTPTCANGAVKTYAFSCQGGEWRGGSGCVNGPSPAAISVMRSIEWRLAPGSKAGSSLSLYRLVDTQNATGPGDEIAEGVVGMRFEYLVDGSYRDASAVTAADEWGDVTAVRVWLEFEGEDLTGATQNSAGTRSRITRTVAHTIALRNRLRDID